MFTLKDHQLEGTPDGQAVDKDDNLWVALFNGYKVIKIATDKPETLLGSIDLPAKQASYFKLIFTYKLLLIFL